MHEIDDKIVLFFNYGQFKAAIALTTRDTKWRNILIEWDVKHVGCPQEFSNLCYWK